MRIRFFPGVVFVLLLALVARAVWLAIFPIDPIGPVDAEGFHLLAVNVMAGRGFAIGWEPPFCPTAVRTPLYPLFLMGSYAVLGTSPARAVLVQLLLEVITTAFAIRLGRDFGGEPAGVLAGLLYALNGSTQRYTGYLLSEVLLLPLLAAALLATVRHLRHPSARRAALAGLLWGLALLTKPNVQYLALAVGAVVASRELRIAHCTSRSTHHVSRFIYYVLRFTFYVVLPLIPWLLRNRIVFDRWLLSTAFEENLARVAAVATLADVDGVRAEPWTATWEHYYDRFVVDVAARYGWNAGATLDEPCAVAVRRQRQVTQAAREVVLAHLLPYGRTHARGVLSSVLDPGHGTWYRALAGRDWETTGVVRDVWARIAWSLARWAVGDALKALWSERVVRPPLAAAAVWWGLVAARVAVWVLAVRGALRLRRRPWVLATLLLTVGYLIVLPGPIAYDRFYLPAIPAVAVLVALGIGRRRFPDKENTDFHGWDSQNP